MDETYLKGIDYNEATVKIQEVPLNIARQFNCIFAEDGKKILFTDKNELELTLNNKLLNRNITFGFD